MLRRLQAVRRDGDRGSVSLELAILFPILLVLLLAVVQTALWFYARHLALAAAQEGVRAGRANHAALDDADPAARAFLARTDDDTLRNVTVSTSGSSPTQVRVRVSGTVVSVLPGLSLPDVSQQASGAREVFTTTGPP